MSETLFFVLELIGTIAFAASGAMVGLKKGMDIFGVAILGLCTAVGGGVIRDLVLGITPPVTFQDPVYALIAIATSIAVFLPAVRSRLERGSRLYDVVMLLMDSIGLGVFTVVGVQSAYSVSSSYSIFLLAFVGVITGVGGGVLRDVLAGDTPYIFVKHFYACASLIGALLCSLAWMPLGSTAATLLGAAAVVALRLCAAYFRWNLPKASPSPGWARR